MLFSYFSILEAHKTLLRNKIDRQTLRSANLKIESCLTHLDLHHYMKIPLTRLSFHIMKGWYISLLPLLLCSLTFSLSAQSITIDRQVMGSAGNSIQLENVCFSYSVGEAIINSLQRSNQPVFTQGFQQPIRKRTLVNTSSHQSLPDWDISLYPNPTTDLIQLQINAKNQTDFQVEVLDYLGRFVFSKEISAFSEVSTLDCRSLVSGTYWVRVLSKDRLFMITRSFQLVR